jgi:hypothetical protein
MERCTRKRGAEMRDGDQRERVAVMAERERTDAEREERSIFYY